MIARWARHGVMPDGRARAMGMARLAWASRVRAPEARRAPRGALLQGHRASPVRAPCRHEGRLRFNSENDTNHHFLQK